MPAHPSRSNLRAARQPIAIFDTALVTSNIGDGIIMEAVSEVLEEIFGTSRRFERFSTREYISASDYWKLRQCGLSIVGGTNILSSNMLLRKKGRWRLTPLDAVLLRNVVLLGVGWRNYEEHLDLLSKVFFKRALSSQYLHSVRDEYTLTKLSRVLKNVIFTGCPTLWSLTPAKCETIPTTKAPAAIVSIAYHTPDPRDADFIRLVKEGYQTLYLWCQQRELDVRYAKTLEVCNSLPIIDDLASYDRLLKTKDIDVIGTRLHGGIRAMQFGRRGLILPVDNRAIEMGRSSNLPVVDRGDIGEIKSWIDRSSPVAVSLPWDAIAAWKSQFIPFYGESRASALSPSRNSLPAAQRSA